MIIRKNMAISSHLIYDYFFFAALIIASLVATFYVKFRGTKLNTKAEYVFAASAQVSIGAMLLSFARGTLGVRSFLGFPAELYYYGASMFEIIYGTLLAFPIVAYVFVPVYLNLGITSVYQYLDLRFKSRLVRCLASGTFLLRSILNTGVTVFTPSVALKTFLGFPYWASIILITAISITLAIIGNLKAVILTDVIQGFTMISASLAIIIIGTRNVGGVEQVYKANLENGRLNLFNFDTDPTLRVTTLTALFGQLFISSTIFGCQQNFVQRYCNLRSLKRVQCTLLANIPVIGIIFSLSWIVGMVIYADYLNCDPLTVGLTSKIDELVPFYAEDKFVNIPGLLGIFMAGLFNGALSMSVSNINAMATVAWEDFVSQIPCFKNFKDSQQLIVIQILGIVVGLLIMGVAFGVALLSGVIESQQLMSAATSGPLLGVFVMAMIFPVCNWKGAASGMIISHLFSLWLTVGSRFITKNPIPMLPLSITECSNDTSAYHKLTGNYSFSDTFLFESNSSDFKDIYTYVSQSSALLQQKNVLEHMYSISYMYYAIIGCSVSVFFGVIISYLTGTSEKDIYDEKLIHPVAMKISKFFPGRSRNYLKDTIIFRNEKSENPSSDVNIGHNIQTIDKEDKSYFNYKNNLKMQISKITRTMSYKIREK